MIENVGNLVCPALFDLGEQSRVVIASVTEGDDKPIKYPHMFRDSEVMILNKIDLLPYVPFDVDRCLDLRTPGQSAHPRHPGVGAPRRWPGRVVRLDSQRGEEFALDRDI